MQGVWQGMVPTRTTAFSSQIQEKAHPPFTFQPAQAPESFLQFSLASDKSRCIHASVSPCFTSRMPPFQLVSG